MRRVRGADHWWCGRCLGRSGPRNGTTVSRGRMPTRDETRYQLCCEAAMSSSRTVSTRSSGEGERDRRWFSRAFVLVQVAIAVVAVRRVLWISRESIGNILGIWLPGWLVRVDNVITLCALALLLVGVVQITWPVKRRERSVVAWAACWGLFNVFLIWFVLHLAYRVNDLIAFTTGREILISVWPGRVLSWLLVNGLPVVGLVAGYGVAQALNNRFGGTLWKRRTLHVFFGIGLIILLLGYIEPLAYRGLASSGVWGWIDELSSQAIIHSFTAYGLLWALPLLIWLGFGFMMLRRARRQIRLYPAHTKCPQCGYDLRGDLEPGCPECGWRRR